MKRTMFINTGAAFIAAACSFYFARLYLTHERDTGNSEEPTMSRLIGSQKPGAKSRSRPAESSHTATVADGYFDSDGRKLDCMDVDLDLALEILPPPLRKLGLEKYLGATPVQKEQFKQIYTEALTALYDVYAANSSLVKSENGEIVVGVAACESQIKPIIVDLQGRIKELFPDSRGDWLSASIINPKNEYAFVDLGRLGREAVSYALTLNADGSIKALRYQTEAMNANGKFSTNWNALTVLPDFIAPVFAKHGVAIKPKAQPVPRDGH